MRDLFISPVTLTEANAFVKQHHRHHGPTQGGLFAIGCAKEEIIETDRGAYPSAKIVGVCIVGRPVARGLDNGFCAEVTRLCTDGTKNTASMLYAAAWRAARAMGYRVLVTYILDAEAGTSLKAAGWKVVGEVKGRSWSCASRPRVDKHPLQGKLRFEISI